MAGRRPSVWLKGEGGHQAALVGSRTMGMPRISTPAHERRTDSADRVLQPAAQSADGQRLPGHVHRRSEATSYAVNALLSAPQMLWRWEVGDPAMAASSPAGIPLTDHELATQLSFFLTDQPPDDSLLAAANAGTLRANLPAHVDDLLATQTARDWLRTIIETYFRINRLAAGG